MSLLVRVPWWLWSIVSGVLVACSQPTLIPPLHGRTAVEGFGWLAFVAYVPALMCVRGHGPKRAFAVGFISSLVHFSGVLHWILYTLHDYGGIPWIISFAILLLLCTALAAYVAAAFAITAILQRRYQLPLWLVFPCAITAVEYLRNHGPVGGFPWAAVGHSLATVPWWLASASLWGVFGLTFVCAVFNAAIASVAPMHTANNIEHLRGWKQPRGGLVLAAIVVVTVAGWHMVRPNLSTVTNVQVAMIQPNDNASLTDITHEPTRAKYARYMTMQAAAVERGAQLLVWPEAAFPLGQRVDDPRFERLVTADQTPPPASVVGAAGYRKGNTPADDQRFNSVFFVDNNLDVKGVFHKSHLVPFGEYVPWPLGGIIRQFIPVGALTPMEKLEPTTLQVAGVPISMGPTVCYEALFPEVTRTIVGQGAQLLVNVTDDRWYGVSAMSHQHLLMNVLRAVENGRTLLRSTNTGISAWVDPDGGIHDATGLYTEAILEAKVPVMLRPTPYTALGDVLPWLCLLWVLPAWIAAMLPSKRRAQPTPALVVMAAGVGLVVLGLVHWQTHLLGKSSGEAVATQSLLLVVFGLLTSVGIASERRWGRRALVVTAVLCGVFVVFALALKSSLGCVLLLIAAAACMWARRSLHSLAHREP
jgi:apolipoprotein N-acyltransferase